MDCGSRIAIRSTIPLCLLLVGCKTGTLPDPNDPNNPGMIQADVLRKDIQASAENIFVHVNKGEISDAEGHKILRDYANTLLEDVKVRDIDPAHAWEYAEVMKTAERWQEAKDLLEIALKNVPANDWDRRVNDTLRLAVVKTKLGDISGAIADARKTFEAPLGAKVPIIYGVLLEIAPAALGHGHDKELADLLVDASDQASQAKVDANTQEGKNFLFARSIHQRNALMKAEEIYRTSGDQQKAEQTGKRLLQITDYRG
ncbi:hypothetical protein BH11ARM2_BH11ARM2_05840 [soil metagenome]